MFNVETQTVEMERAVVNFTPDQVREALLDKLRADKALKVPSDDDKISFKFTTEKGSFKGGNISWMNGEKTANKPANKAPETPKTTTPHAPHAPAHS